MEGRTELWNESIAFIAKETGYSLEYIGDMEPAVFNALLTELTYMKRVDEYNAARPTIEFMAHWLNAHMRHSKNYTAEHFLGEPPTRGITHNKEDIWEVAKRAGIRIPVNVT